MNSTLKNNTKTLVIVAGPTASGKTAAGVKLAGHYNSEVISADARQLFRLMNIGTAVPSHRELNDIPHHFLQCISPEENYNASRFEAEVLELLRKLFSEHDIIFLVGGSGMYIDALCDGIDDLPSFDPEIRKKYAEKYRLEGLESIQEELKKVDPETYARIDINNHMRILKALEVSTQTGKPYSSFLSRQPKQRSFNILRIALDPGREALYERINSRVDRMMEEGLLDEARNLYHLKGLTALKTVGYKELFSYMDGNITLEEAVDLIKRNTRKYARKQITWFRKGDKYRWFSPENNEEMITWIDSNLKEPE